MFAKQIKNKNTNLFYKNAIKKYFNCFQINKFEIFIYFEYYKFYTLRNIKNNSLTIVKKQSFEKKSILIRIIKQQLYNENVFFYN